MVKLHNLNDSSVIPPRAPGETEHYWDVHWDVTRAVNCASTRKGSLHPVPRARCPPVPGEATAPAQVAAEPVTGEPTGAMGPDPLAEEDDG